MRSLVSRGGRGTLRHSNMFHNVSDVVWWHRRNTFASLSEDELPFRGRRSTLETPIIVLLGRRSALDVSRCVFVANRIVGAASSGDKVQIPWQAWHFVTRMKHRF